MITNAHLRRMNRIELVQYGLEGERQHRRAADELFRRFYARYHEKGLLDRSLARAEAPPSMPPEPSNVRSIL